MTESVNQIDGKDVAIEAIDELRKIKTGETKPFQPTADVDLVWVVSQPGTYLEPYKTGIYKGLMLDKDAIDYGVRLVREITTLRLRKLGEDVNVDDLSKETIQDNGPLLYYNGEDSTTVNNNYPQNEDFKVVLDSPDFPLPQEKVVIDHIDTANTPSQIEGLMSFLSKNPDIHKIAVISNIAHSRRVGRYLEGYRLSHPDSFPQDVEFLNAWLPVDEQKLGITLREVRKVGQYFEKGDLAEKPIKGF